MQRFDIEQGEVLLSIQYTLALEAQRAEARTPKRPWAPPSWRPEELATVVSIAQQAQTQQARQVRPHPAQRVPAAGPVAAPVAARSPAAAFRPGSPAVMPAAASVAVPARAPAAAVARHPSRMHPSTIGAPPGGRQAGPNGAWVRDVVTKSFSGGSSPSRRAPASGPSRARPGVQAAPGVQGPPRNASELGLLDPATGAGSSRALRRDLAQAFAAPGATGADGPGVHLVAMQVEPLSEIRRRDGDQAAERLLRTAVQTVSPLLRSRDRVYRTGPNQLALLLHAVGEDGVESALARLARQVPGLLAGQGVSGVRIVLRRVHVRRSELPGAPTPGAATR